MDQHLLVYLFGRYLLYTCYIMLKILQLQSIISQESAPKVMHHEAIVHLNDIINRVVRIPKPFCKALRNYAFLGDDNPENAILDRYADFVVNMALGLDMDASFLYIRSL